MELSRAILEVVDPQGSDAARGLPSQIKVQFNPTQLTLARTATYERIKALDAGSPLLQFTGSDLEDLKLDLFFDTTMNSDMTTDPVDVRTLTDPFEQLALKQPGASEPPVVRLVWGDGLSFKGVAVSVSQTFEMFAPSGVPVRAQVATTLREYRTRSERDAAGGGGARSGVRTRQVGSSDTLPLIAAQEYGSAAAWVHIAAANADKIRNPRSLRPGDVLTLPRLAGLRSLGR